MESVTADKTMHIQLLKIQELRSILQQKDKIINELNCKIESDMTSHISQTCQLKIDDLKYALMCKNDEINDLKYALMCKNDEIKLNL
jgi:hypothetical protein